MNAEAVHPLKAFRMARKITLGALAKEIGVAENTVWRWENGRMPRRREWPKIAAVTGITPRELASYARAEAA